jgi:hypothetical protein
MEQDHNKEIERIIDQMHCHKDFTCYNSGLEELCKARDTGMKSFLECLDENGFACSFSMPFGYKRYCQCPLRVYIAEKLGK